MASPTSPSSSSSDATISADAEEALRAPPRTFGATLRRLGPGMIIAGSIVGSGELIATTKVGAEAGFWLLWLIVAGCLIKVFAQVEFGRHAITWSETPLKALNDVPGPRLKVNWLVWYWALMTVLVVTQQGGILGGVGQALAMSRPLTEQGVAYNEMQDALVQARVALAMTETQGTPGVDVAARQQQMEALAAQLAAVPTPPDAGIWAAVVALLTAVLLFFGRYQLIQAAATVLVAAFTATTILTLVLLQRTEWAVQGSEFLAGLSFRLPPADVLGRDPVATAMAAFGIIGLGAAELIMYPYWCLEKGYAKFTGPRDGTPQWIHRARGWVRVLYTDAWLSMVVYTFATVAFYLLGAAVLWRTGLNPEGQGMIRTLAEMYVPVFGPWAHGVFLFGAVAVLYSTFFVAAAGNARMVADGMGLYGLHDGTEAARGRWTRRVSTAWPLVALVLFLFMQAPVAMVLASGVAQAIMLPMLGVAVLYFRYRRSDPGLRPGRVWDVMLWLSCLGFLLAGGWTLYSTLLS